MNYDGDQGLLVVFGGGGAGKQRFNCISVLDWRSKTWIEMAAKENEPAPWERTYHVAEFKFPNLIIFGGETADDMDDLWLYNFQ